MDSDDNSPEPRPNEDDDRSFKDALFEVVFRESVELVGGIAAIVIAAGLLWLFFG